MKVLVVIDMQNDFITGTLGTKEAVSIVPNVISKIKKFNGKILATRDTHPESFLETLEGKKLPIKHCIYGTNGWEIEPQIQKLLKQEPIDKTTFGSIELGKKLIALNEKEHIENITLIGLCTDICVVSNALLLKAFLPETPIIVDDTCCAGVTPASHKQALETMRMCHIEIDSEKN